MLGIETWGLEIVLWFQSWRTPLLDSLVVVFHELGQFTPYLLLLPVFYWSVDRRFGARLAAWLVVGAFLNFWIKDLLRWPRPYTDTTNGVNNVVSESLPGLPSGHAQMAVMYWGLVGTWARRRWVWVAVTLYALLMGLSRVVGGVHFPQDVLAGWLLGVAWLALYLGVDAMLSDGLARIGLWAQMALALVAGVLLAILLRTEDGATLGGAVAGLGIGLALAVRWAAFDAGGVWWRRVGRYVLGVVGMVALRFGVGALFEGLQPEFALRFVRFGLIGAWTTFAAPLIFLRIGLAQPDPDASA